MGKRPLSAVDREEERVRYAAARFLLDAGRRPAVGRTNTAKKYAGDDEMTTVMPRKFVDLPSRAEQAREAAIARAAAERDERIERHLEREAPVLQAPELASPKSSREARRDSAPPSSAVRERRGTTPRAPQAAVEQTMWGARPDLIAPAPPEEKKRNTPIPSSRARVTPPAAEPIFTESLVNPSEVAASELAVPSVFKQERPSNPPPKAAPMKAAPAKPQLDTAPVPFAPATADASGKRRRVSLPELHAPTDARGWAVTVSAVLSGLGVIFAMGMLCGRFGLFHHEEAAAATSAPAATAEMVAEAVPPAPPAPPAPEAVAPVAPVETAAPPAAAAPTAPAMPCVPPTPVAQAESTEKGDAAKPPPPSPESPRKMARSRAIHRVPAPAPPPQTFRSGGAMATMPKHAAPAAKRPAPPETTVAAAPPAPAPPPPPGAVKIDNDVQAAAAADKLAKAQLEAAFR